MYIKSEKIITKTYARYLNIVRIVSLKNNVCLQHLAENRIGNEGAEAISDMLQKNDMIYSLDLSGNSIEDYGAEKLCRVLLVNSILSNLITRHD